MEHNMILVKPDPSNQKRFVEAISADLLESGYEIVAVRNRQLSSAEFEGNFICKSSQHLAYITSGPIAAILYRGHSAVGFGRNYKFHFRKQHSTDKLKNILHSTEPGNEFAVQFELFFPNLNITEHHQFADQGVYFSSLKEIQSGELSRLASFNLIAANNEEANSRQFKETCSLRNCRYVGYRERIHSSTELLRYRRKADLSAKDMPEVRVLLLHDLQEYSQHIRHMKETHKIHGVVCYKPKFTLLETEMLRTSILENNLFCVGGSFGGQSPGSIRASQELADMFDAHFERI
ncbi:Nucleoside diphosphate kinase [Pseudovibrio sp. Ad46]|uniref:nucleoside-diphosphate kinase n=1 Tax=Pseudovibrio sp. Ad46 TaxID=989432 RepID=UPI0007AE4BF4|nr:nucleoside-diphosphate kinase [Pseudovibrio sp. Ad46]KZK93794.1 Nucleoside diphosphate kinase [Pseudovibrio sp. Ad46]